MRTLLLSRMPQVIALALVWTAGCTVSMTSDMDGTMDNGTDGAGSVDDTTNAALIADCTGDFPTEDVDGPVTFTVDGTRIVMMGVYMDDTSDTLLGLLDNNPDVRTIVMANVGGSDVSNDQNLDGGREIRRRNINTCVPEGGLVASGGTDFFAAGARRLVMNGGRVGVHSWEDSEEDGSNVVAGNEVPRDDARHDPLLSFYEDIGIPEDFYWFTLDAAPASDMYFMTTEELVQFGLIENGN